MAAKRGRPSKKAKVEEPIKEVEVEAVVEETPIEEPSVEKTNKFFKDAIVEEDVYDLNSGGESKLGGSYNPFGESVEEKAYRTPKIATAESIPDIDEPAFVAPTYEDLVTANETVGQNGENGEPVVEEKTGLDRFSQDEVKEMKPEDKKEAAEGLTTVVLGMYSMGCSALGGLTKISDSKLSQLEQDDLLDVSMRVPVDRHTTASVRKIVDSMNEQASEAFEVSDDFKEKVTPVMTRVFEKHGWGVTDEQNLMIMFGMDIAQKAQIVIQMRNAANYQLEAFMKMHDTQKQSARPVEFTSPEGGSDTPSDTRPQASQVVKEEEEPKVDNDGASKSMVATDNPDLKVSMSDLAQVDVDNV